MVSARAGVITAGFAILACHAQAFAADVALTIDDVPELTVIHDPAHRRQFNTRLAQELHRHHIPATAFVIGSQISGPGQAEQRLIVKRWRKFGIELGNHTFSHASPNKLGADAYIADIAEGQKALTGLVPPLPGQTRWFRPPYLETGSPAPVRQQISAWLADHGLSLAPVTMNSSDYVFAVVYQAALAAKDKARARSVRQAYLVYTKEMIAWSRSASHRLFGRDIAYVMLLHDSRLNADCLDDLVKVFTQAGLRFVSLEQAMTDPAYATPDRYSGPDGIDWLERWLLERTTMPDAEDEPEPPGAIRQDYDRLVNDDH